MELEALIRQAKDAKAPIIIISDSVLNRTDMSDLIHPSAIYSEPGQHNIDSDYRVVISEADVDLLSPFKLRPEMLEIAQKTTRGIHNSYDKAKTLFDYVDTKISYGDTKRTNGIRDSEEVFLTQEGICSELTFLYVAMARSVGLRAGYAHVDVDYAGDKVNHACAVVDLGRDVLADVAYHKFDVAHLDWYKLDDMQAIDNFRRVRSLDERLKAAQKKRDDALKDYAEKRKRWISEFRELDSDLGNIANGFSDVAKKLRTNADKLKVIFEKRKHRKKSPFQRFLDFFR